MKKKEEQLRKQIDSTALPEDYAGKAQNALEDIKAIIKTMAIAMAIGAICIGAWIWIG
jgi:predicted PurR-regulated permease PerM